MLKRFTSPAREILVMSAKLIRSQDEKRHILELELSTTGRIHRDTVVATSLCDLVYELVTRWGLTGIDAQDLVNNAMGGN